MLLVLYTAYDFIKIVYETCDIVNHTCVLAHYEVCIVQTSYNLKKKTVFHGKRCK